MGQWQLAYTVGGMVYETICDQLAHDLVLALIR